MLLLINNKYTIEISCYSSIYLLKKLVKEKLNLQNINDINLWFNGKLLNNNSKSLQSYNLKNNSNINSSLNLKGGDNTESTWFFYLIYYISIPIFLIFMCSGLPPFIANVYAYIFDKTIITFLEMFNMKKNDIASKIIRAILNIIMWILTKLATVFFIWILTAYMFFPWLYSRKNDFCNAGLAAKDIGFWVTLVFILIYGGLNIFDFFINISQSLIDFRYDPEIIKAYFGPSLQATKEAWDVSKFLPLYSIPFIGQIFLIYHEIISEGFSLMYESLDIVQQFDCEKPSTSIALCDMLKKILKVVRKPKNESKHNITNRKEPISMENLQTDFMNKIESGAIKEQIKNYKLEPLIELLQIGFCDKKAKIQGKKIPEYKGEKYEKGSFNRWSSSVATSIFCQMTEALQDITNTLWEIGTEDQVVNMIKTGNFAGVLSSILIIIFYIYTFFASSFGGFKYA